MLNDKCFEIDECTESYFILNLVNWRQTIKLRATIFNTLIY